MTYCIIIPHYNHERQFLAFLPKILTVGLPCIIVDDGSSKESLACIRDSVAKHENVTLVEHGHNRGKGAAVISGIFMARAKGFSHALQIDADGQHNVSDIQRFIAVSESAPDTIVCGRPVFDDSVPKIRLYGRKITDFWVVLETLSRKVKDGLCGFRIYPLKKVEVVLDAYYLGKRMDFDTEILVKALWLGVDLEFVDTQVIYPEESVSHFNYVRDNLGLVSLHTRLMCGMVVRFPMIVYRLFKGSDNDRGD